MACCGIDLGDATSCIAVARKGGVDVLLNKESKRETPSVITFTHKQRMMGTDAVGGMSTNPRNTINQLKRLLGKKFSDPHVQEDLQHFPYKVEAGPNGECMFNVQYMDKSSLFTAEQLIAMLLVDLKLIAEAEGCPVTECVLSVPVYYTEPERHAMLAAAQIAGLNCLRLLNETTATALSYGIYKTDLPEGDPVNVVFVDIGFSSTQVCVVALKKGQLQVLSNAWDRDLGGRNLDNVLFDHFVNEFNQRYKIDVRSQPRACHRLRMGCEKMKKVLTTNSEAPINVECIMNDVDASGLITREVFEEAATPVLDRLLSPIKQALADAGLEASQVSSVEVVGGSTRVPSVLRQLTDFFGREPSRTLNAKETVSRGCALQCAMLSPTFRVRDFQVLDSFPYGVQFSWDKDGQQVTSTVFERGSLVPSAKMLTFYRSQPFTIKAEYTPDSNIPSTADRSIGSFDVGPFQLPAGADKAKLKVKVMLNLNGVVVVEHAQVIEEEEYEEEAAAAAPAAADQPMEDADAAKAAGAEGGAAAPEAADAAAAPAPAAGGDAPMAEDAVGAAEPQKVLKKRVKKHSVPFVSHTAALSADQLQKLYEVEVELALQARIQGETNDAKNALEAYIYGLRNRLSDALAPHIREEAKAALLEKLEALENWLYEEGEDEVKSVYTAKLADVRQLGDPVEARAANVAALPAAAASLRRACQSYLAALGESRTAHLEEADKDAVAGECQAALDWLNEKEGLQKKVAKYDDPMLLAADVEKKEGTVRRVCEPILSKPPPAPKKEEAAAAEDMDTDAEVGPQPPTEEEEQQARQETPMEA
ncbi:hypothetical protein D9Q98_000706 [Chlorella vulgaris]|uniref:Uncharacterized protein n=1 Tax=Chlorella vulgaris TaxID=3077 RepID=A0A9D4TZT9_CHLVU|nr:hypothetical protein D9Q98_000706 [Chlorella vulgaris]